MQTGLERGYWKQGDLLLDPFAGVSCGGIAAADNGLRWLGVELEPRFVDMSEQNFLLHYERWEREGKPFPEVIQGDSRKLREIVKQTVTSIVTSPPYGNRVDDHGTDKPEYRIVKNMGDYGELGKEEGQIGVMRAHASGSITSPPFSQPETRDRHLVQSGVIAEAMQRAYTADHQGTAEGNIAAMPVVDGGVSSPPYNEGLGHGGGGESFRRLSEEKKLGDTLHGYGKTGGQVGKTGGEDYWSACRQVYQELFSLLAPCSVLALVVKDYTRAGKIVTLCDQTITLLQECGFIPLERTYCQMSSVDKKTGQTKWNKGFFRRMQEKKGTIPRIDYEEVQWYLRP